MAGTASRRGLSAPPVRLLLCAHKSDQLTRSADDLTPQTKQTAHERIRSILTREMDRLKLARGAGVGGRIEGMGKVQGGSTSWWARLFGAAAPEAEAEDDEAAVWGGAGPFRWEDVEGVQVEWAASALGPVGEERERGNGLDELTDFMWGL
jgi:signal recognition particle receptor subunit beta